MDSENLRLAVYGAFAATGRAPHWYDGRLDRGYIRREPAQAASYLRGVGLSGPFWGL